MKVRVNRTIDIPISRMVFVCIYALLIALVFSIFFKINLFENTDEFILQKISQHSSWKHKDSKVLGVELNKKDFKRVNWESLLLSLKESGAETLVTTVPFDVELIPKELEKNTIVGLSKDFLAIKDNSTLKYLEEKEISWGVADPWLDYKSQNARPLEVISTVEKQKKLENVLNLNSLPSLDKKVFEKYNLDKKTEKDFYRINTIDGYKRIPIMTLTEFENALKVKDLLKNKVIVIGRARDDHPVLSSVKSFQDPITQTHYWALSLDSLLTDKTFEKIGIYSYVFLLLVFLSLNLFFQMYFRSIIGFSFFVISVLMSAVLSWKLLEYESVFLPLSDLILAKTILVLIYNFDVRSYTRSSVKDFNSSLTSQLNSVGIDHSNLNSKSFWDGILNYFTHSLDLQKIVLLEEKPTQAALDLISSYNCTKETLSYQILNKKKSPYSLSLSALMPHPLSQKAFLNSDDSSLDFIVPLKFSKKNLGYLFLSLDKNHHLKIENRFPGLIKMLAEYISELLFFRQQNEKAQGASSAVQRFLQHEDIDKNMLQLENLSLQLNQNFNFLSSFAYSISSGSAVYDLFGNLVFTNHKMKSLMSKSKIGIGNMSAPELLSELTGMSKQATLSYFRKILIDKEDVVLPAILSVPHDWKENEMQHIETEIKLKTMSVKSNENSNLYNSATSILIEIVQKQRSQAKEQKNVESVENVVPLTLQKSTNLHYFEKAFNVVAAKHSRRMKEKNINLSVMTSLKFQVHHNIYIFNRCLDFFLKELIEDANEGADILCYVYKSASKMKIVLETEGLGLVENFKSFQGDSEDLTEKQEDVNSLLKDLEENNISYQLTNLLGLGVGLVLTLPLAELESYPKLNENRA